MNTNTFNKIFDVDDKGLPKYVDPTNTINVSLKKLANYNKPSITSEGELLVLFHDFLDVRKTGSKYICTPPVVDTDEDYICLAEGSWEDIDGSMEAMGYVGNGEKYEKVVENSFKSYKNKDNVNLIITKVKLFFDKWVVATEIANQQNLLLKQDRIKLFEKVLYGNHT